MPFYDYVCQRCQHSFEELVSSASQRPPCPECAAEEVARQIPNTFAVGKASPRVSAPAGGPGCGRCGDPRGPGACAR